MATISKKFAIKIRNLHQCSNDNRQVCQLWQAQDTVKLRVWKSLRILELFLYVTASQVNYIVHFKLEEEDSKDPTQVVRVWLFSQLALRKFWGFLLTRFVSVQNFSLYSSNSEKIVLSQSRAFILFKLSEESRMTKVAAEGVTVLFRDS